VGLAATAREESDAARSSSVTFEVPYKLLHAFVVKLTRCGKCHRLGVGATKGAGDGCSKDGTRRVRARPSVALNPTSCDL
jgi:hypothetical protein